jgi:hypothetical protein
VSIPNLTPPRRYSNLEGSNAPVVSFQVCWACVSDLNDFVCNSMLSVRSAGIHTVNVIDAAANGILFDNSDAHSVGCLNGDAGPG